MGYTDAIFRKAGLGGEPYTPPLQITIGDTYWVPLEQDWVTCTVAEVTEKYVVVNYHGRLHSYGVPQYFHYVDIDHFKSAWELAPEGHWSRQYDET